MAYYAWSPIKFRNRSKEVDNASVGEEVSAGSLNISDEEFSQLIESRSVRNRPYPNIPPTFTGSPRDWELIQASKALEDVEDNFDVEELIEASEEEATEEVTEEIV